MGKKLGVDQFAELGASVQRQLPRDLDPELVQYWVTEQGALAVVLRGALSARPISADLDTWVDELDLTKVERRVFEVTIDPTQTIEQMVAAGNYTYANPNHTTAIFGSCRKITGTTPVTAKVMAFRIGRNATREQAKLVRARLNLGVICIQHELALGAQHKRAQQDLNWIVNPDDEVLVGGYRHVSYLYGRDVLRDLDLRGADFGWDGRTWFLGLLSESA